MKAKFFGSLFFVVLYTFIFVLTMVWLDPIIQWNAEKSVEYPITCQIAIIVLILVFMLFCFGAVMAAINWITKDKK